MQSMGNGIQLYRSVCKTLVFSYKRDPMMILLVKDYEPERNHFMLNKGERVCQFEVECLKKQKMMMMKESAV